jgi:hypothetical protein
MKGRWLASVTSAAMTLAAACAGTARADLKPGDPAPAFELKGSDGKTHSLAEFAQKRAVVIAWFPKAFTGG